MLPRLSYTFACIEPLNRRPWVEGTTIVSHGTRVGVRTDARGLLSRLESAFPPGSRPSSVHKVRRLYSVVASKPPRNGGRRTHILYMNAARVVRSTDLDEIVARLEGDMELYVAERARARVFVHAGVVAWNGSAIVLPGRTLSGKTTLVRELLAAGATYYSDEFAVLDARGRVHPFPRPLSIRGTRPGALPTRRSADELGATVGRGPLPVGLVAMTRYREGGRWRPRRLSGGRALLALLEHTVPARRRPEASVEALQAVVAGAPVLTGTRGEARDTIEALLDRSA